MMFDIGWSELLCVAIIAVIFFEPKDGSLIIKKIRSLTNDLKQTKQKFYEVVEDIEDEIDLQTLQEDLNKPIDDFEDFVEEYLDNPKKQKRKK